MLYNIQGAKKANEKMRSIFLTFFLIPSIVILLGGTFCQNASTRTASMVPDSISCKPLAVGSYWVYQDSFFTEEDLAAAHESADENPVSLRKDSIVHISNISGNIHLEMVRMYLNRKHSLLPDTIHCKVDLQGHLFEKTYNPDIQGGTWSEGYIAILNPKEGDTAYADGDKSEIYVYEKLDTDEYLLKPIIMKQYGWRSYYFKKGIGLIGVVTKNFSTNLIEYRIGTGSVVKKHWLMEQHDKN